VVMFQFGNDANVTVNRDGVGRHVRRDLYAPVPIINLAIII